VLGARPAGSTNYAAGGVKLTTLINLLVEFFGGALGCSDTTVAAYTGANMSTVHRVCSLSSVSCSLCSIWVSRKQCLTISMK
jgi:hypothetical protein